MDKIMMWVMAICALIGGVDQLAGEISLVWADDSRMGFNFSDDGAFYGWVDLYNTVAFTGLEHTIVSALQDPSS